MFDISKKEEPKIKKENAGFNSIIKINRLRGLTRLFER